MKLTLRQRPDGIALIIVMVVILAITVLAGGFAYSMKVEMKLAANHNAGSGLEWLGRSGMEYAKHALAVQMKNAAEPYDALHQRWAGGPGSLNPDAFAEDYTLDNLQLGDGTFSVKIVDLERKMNINLADPSILQQALKLMGVDASQTPIISDSLDDWRDRDENKHLSGAESDYYLALKPAYYCKNGPLDDPTEMLLIQGITPAMFWGPRYVSHMNQGRLSLSPSQRAQQEEPSYPVGLADLFNTLSTRFININTAGAEVLQLIPGVDENAARSILTARAGPDGADGTIDDVPFRSAGELVNVSGLSRQLVQAYLQRGLLSVRSATYEVTVDAELYGVRKRFTGVLRRSGPTDVQLLRFYWD
jgi:Type II secretion system (T2SS), protein K